MFPQSFEQASAKQMYIEQEYYSMNMIDDLPDWVEFFPFVAIFFCLVQTCVLSKYTHLHARSLLLIRSVCQQDLCHNSVLLYLTNMLVWFITPSQKILLCSVTVLSGNAAGHIMKKSK